MKLMIKFYDGAVNKITVGQKLMILTIVILFHKHLSIEPIIQVIGYFHKVGIIRFRELLFNGFYQKDAFGIIFTFVWAFEQNANWEYIEIFTEILSHNQTTAYLTALVYDQKNQIYRNELENIFLHKPFKRDLEWSKDQMKIGMQFYHAEIYENEIEYPSYFYAIETAK